MKVSLKSAILRRPPPELEAWLDGICVSHAPGQPTPSMFEVHCGHQLLILHETPACYPSDHTHSVDVVCVECRVSFSTSSQFVRLGSLAPFTALPLLRTLEPDPKTYDSAEMARRDAWADEPGLSDREHGYRLFENAHDRLVNVYLGGDTEQLARAIGDMDQAFFLVFNEKTKEV